VIREIIEGKGDRGCGDHGARIARRRRGVRGDGTCGTSGIFGMVWCGGSGTFTCVMTRPWASDSRHVVSCLRSGCASRWAAAVTSVSSRACAVGVWGTGCTAGHATPGRCVTLPLMSNVVSPALAFVARRGFVHVGEARGGTNGRRCSRARAPLCHIRRADTFKRVAETRPRLANVVGKGRFSLIDFLPEVRKLF
jgi:hypothetical protein